MDYKNPVLYPEERAKALLSLMTLEEKVAQMDIIRGVEFSTKPHKLYHCAVYADSEINEEKLAETLSTRGIGFIHDCYSHPIFFNKLQKFMVEKTRLGIPCMFTGEALHGILWPGATVFPVPLALAASFDRSNVNKIGRAIASETRALGMHEILAPNLDVAREPRWGRVEETFGEDTYLSSQLAYQIVTGEQQDGNIERADAVVCEPKHYCVHGIPENGINCAQARVGRREIEQSYLPVFETAIKKAGAYNVMACYNAIDGEVVLSSEYYLTDILRKRWGMKGYVRADWGSVVRLRNRHFTAATDEDAICDCVNAGLDMQGCCDYDPKTWEETIVKNVESGRIPMERIDDAVLRVLTIKFKLGLFENPYTDETLHESVIRCEKHLNASHEAAKKSMTLIKNSGILPLEKGKYKKIALLGPSANRQRLGGYSSVPDGYELKSVLDELRVLLGDEVEIEYCNGCGIPKDLHVETQEGQPHLVEVYDEDEKECIEEAVKIAENSDLVIIVGGDNTFTSSEGHDRADLKLAGKQRELVEEVAKTGKPVILVLENGRAVDLQVESGICDAILLAWFGGETGAKAIAETLVGLNNPAGRLPVSFPQDSYRIPCYYTVLPNNTEVMFEGSRRPRYEFGFGLSYTEFEYSDLKIEKKSELDYKASVDVKNIGKVKGDEVVQLYVNDKVSSIITPLKELKGFERITLDVNETKTVEFTLGFDSFKLLNKDFEWVVENGEFEILVGASSNDIRLSETIKIER
ncbi:MAG: glycoside hydrolase family 3 C-terminal domain-containing protein [Clostridia bacterium]|nr:glycoside hydrolase family 3 C-terminal domain-containing protein [Clostridia bacterium]